MNAGRTQDLVKVHRTELSCSDQSDAYWVSLRFTFAESCVQVHVRLH